MMSKMLDEEWFFSDGFDGWSGGDEEDDCHV